MSDPKVPSDADSDPLRSAFLAGARLPSGTLAERPTDWRVARRVFVEGCRVEARWRGRERFTVLESGFGFGLRFLATLGAWQADPKRSRFLHYVSLQAPSVGPEVLRHTLAELLQGEIELQGEIAHGGDSAARGGIESEALAQAVAALVAQWPPAIPGLHRLRFHEGAVTLTLAFGGATEAPGHLVLAADAIYLTNQCGPVDLNSAVRALARHARPGAYLAAHADSDGLREALLESGFDLLQAPGIQAPLPGLQAVWAPRYRRWPAPIEPARLSDRRVIVVGAGLAGTAVASGFARRGFRVDLLDSNSEPGGQGSAQPLVADHLHLSPDDNPLARLSRAALLLRRGLDSGLPIDREDVRVSGRLTLASDAGETDRQGDMLARLAFPRDFVRQVSASEASAIAGIPLSRAGLWLPYCEALSPHSEIQRWLAAAREAIRFHANSGVDRLERHPHGDWMALASDGQALAKAPLIVLANAGDAARLGALSGLPLSRVRGQSTWLREPSLRTLKVVLGGDAYAVPAGEADGRLLLGASFDERDSLLPDPADDIGNVARLAQMLDRDAESMLHRASPAVVGWRWTLSDHLPAIGPLPDLRVAEALAPDLRRNDRLPIPMSEGLYGAFAFGSRGLLWAALAAELLPAMVCGEPLPIERELVAALAPSRFLRRRLRRGA